MKTKIIYISGNETFEMHQIRAAFEEVRETLGLDKDTILFGVPIDCDSAVSEVKPAETVVSNEKSEPIPTIPEISDVTVDETVTVTEPVMIEPVMTEPVAEVENTVKANVVEEDKVVPILSVLAINDDEPETEPVVAEEVEIAEDVDVVTEDVDVVPESEDIIEPAAEELVDVAEPESDISEIEVEDVAEVAEITDTEIPESPMEKTLEELLESMTPLREDVTPHENTETVVVIDDVDVMQSDETDATLAQLATEFVQNEDKIPSAPKTETSGKIGKLKNILPLPFKKVKRDDSGIMGDLFGWAGMAANDEDFSIPGFFTQAASKK
jgi:hypothetical protein